jgi:hypothetical protein
MALHCLVCKRLRLRQNTTTIDSLSTAFDHPTQPQFDYEAAGSWQVLLLLVMKYYEIRNRFIESASRHVSLRRRRRRRRRRETVVKVGTMSLREFSRRVEELGLE